MAGRSRTRRRKAPPFRAWGSVLILMLGFALYQQLWRASLWIFVILVLYVGLVRVTTCRVETLQHRPCRWRVRGLLRSCDYHTGLKRGLPKLYQSPGAGLALPMLFWPRPDLAVPFDRVDPQPPPAATGAAALAPRDRRLAGYSPEFWIGSVAVLIAFASLVRDLIYG
jgi:hypothetical protein